MASAICVAVLATTRRCCSLVHGHITAQNLTNDHELLLVPSSHSNTVAPTHTKTKSSCKNFVLGANRSVRTAHRNTSTQMSFGYSVAATMEDNTASGGTPVYVVWTDSRNIQRISLKTEFSRLFSQLLGGATQLALPTNVVVPSQFNGICSFLYTEARAHTRTSGNWMTLKARK